MLHAAQLEVENPRLTRTNGQATVIPPRWVGLNNETPGMVPARGDAATQNFAAAIEHP
jgi:hypothetical protein